MVVQSQTDTTVSLIGCEAKKGIDFGIEKGTLSGITIHVDSPTERNRRMSLTRDRKRLEQLTRDIMNILKGHV